MGGWRHVPFSAKKATTIPVDESFAEKWEIWYPTRFNFYEERQYRNDS